MKLKLMNCDAYTALTTCANVDTIFMDPPDNIGLKYNKYEDKMLPADYDEFLDETLTAAVGRAPTVYMSFNAIHLPFVGKYVYDLEGFDVRFLIQAFTFGQNNKTDFTNCFRPIVRISIPDSDRFPERTRIESDRMKMGDKRASSEGKVPSDVWRPDFLEYSRVVGNSKQRRNWHPTQLNEGLVEDLLLMSTPRDGTVLDPFAGTGTTLRVCKKNGWNCSTSDYDLDYCRKIAEEHELEEVCSGIWHLEKD